MAVMYREMLQKIGLTNVEARIYSDLLDAGSSTASEISKRIKVHRRNVYDAMERLMEKGIVGCMMRNNKKCYLAVNPTKLTEIVAEEKAALLSVIPQLKEKLREKQEQVNVSFFQGKIGLRQALDDQISENKEVLVIGGSIKAPEVLGYYIERYDNQRKEHGIRVKVIFSGKYPKKPLSEIRYSPKRFISPAATNIYGNKVALIVWNKNPLVILIESNEIAESYRKNFEIMWKNAGRTPKNRTK